MDLNQEQLKFCIGLATKVANLYARTYPVDNANDPVRDTESLLIMCGEYREKWIRHLESTEPDETVEKMGVLGFTVVTDVGYDIFTVAGMDESMLRLVVAKEAFHVVMDKEEFRNMDLMSHVIEMANNAMMPASVTKLTPSATAELMALVAAMEFFLPYKKRVEELKNGLDAAAIAAKYKVPLAYAETYLSPQAMETFRPVSPN